MALGRDEILNAVDLPREEVKVPEWGGTVFVKTLSGLERDAYEIGAVQDNKRNVRARLAAAAICDPEGLTLFTPDDIERLGAKSGAALDRVFAVARRINAVTKDDVDELEKNS